MILSADIGGTKVLTGLFAPEGDLLVSAGQRLPNPPEPEAVARAVLSSWNWLIGQSRVSWEAVRGGSLAIPGPINPDSGLVLENASLGWKQVPFVTCMEEVGWPSRLPLLIDDDGLLATWGEYRCGGHQFAESLVVLSLGTGVGLGVVQRGRLLRAAELGHIPTRLSDTLCRCGLTGCLETVMGGWGIEEGYARYSRRVGVSVPDVMQAAKAGDSIAVQTLTDAASAFADALVTVILLFNPDDIVIAGGLGRAAWNTWWQPACELVLREKILASHRGTIQRVGPTLLAGRAALEGAFAAFQDRYAEAGR